MPPADQKLPLRERNKIRMRAELLEAVLDLFLADDPNALNIEAVARHAGCSKATVYVYFPGGLNEMLCAIYEQIAEDVNDTAMRLREAEETTHGRIMALARALLEMSTRPRRGKFYAQLNPALSPALQPVLGKASSRYAEIIASDLANEIGGDTRVFALLLVGALREASVRIAKDTDLYSELAAAFSIIVERLLAGDQGTTATEAKS